jgi:hypothetical protein
MLQCEKMKFRNTWPRRKLNLSVLFLFIFSIAFHTKFTLNKYFVIIIYC